MKQIIILIFLLNSFFAFSQKKQQSYYFDCAITSNYKNYIYSRDEKLITFKNTKDSTYQLSISYGKTYKEATRNDFNKRELIKFDVNFDYNNVNDLKKLVNSKLFTSKNLNKQK